MSSNELGNGKLRRSKAEACNDDQQAPLTVIGYGYDALTGLRYTVAEFRNGKGERVEALISAKDKAKGEPRIMDILAHSGFNVPGSSKRRRALVELLDSSVAPDEYVVVSRVGWSEANFCLPTNVYGPKRKRVRLALLDGAANHWYGSAGGYEQWREHVALPCGGNRTLVFGLAFAFAPPLMGICAVESGGFQLTGPSSIGKTMALTVWGSVWGGGGKDGFISSWHTTINAVDTEAALHRHVPVFKDEAKLADNPGGPKAGEIVAKAVFQYTGGQAKRKQPDREKPVTWDALFFSSSEVTFPELAKDANIELTVGQMARMIDIPADAGKGHGIFETLHDETDAASAANALKEAAKTHFGTASDKFLQRLAEDLAKRPKWLKSWVGRRMSLYRKTMPHNNAQGPYQRIGDRFALVYTAGALAVFYDVLPFTRKEILSAVRYCHERAMLDELNAGINRARSGVDVVRAYLTNSIANFGDADGRDALMDYDSVPGFVNRRCRTPEILILKDVFDTIVCAGRDPDKVFYDLLTAGYATRHTTGPKHIHRKLPKPFGRQRVICISGHILKL
ncbi:DUF927 domain-containing protein [Azospirillum rugosum]|uniref:Uncharacterized protein (DUF927 family) n=1 Tax=Azospirillum rugosum TaxID=416170 RepID=A0ABS4SJV7_9PROT|nr:DUF927 domain-containing protein [Azospirillum rugosum]MBP2292237.1 uncharacterized protein (DUF927 family) [Azospirillum rugosum]MDQ0525996.1 uncharacterized protein (DUF927 family) [Azospirillum rugosum]